MANYPLSFDSFTNPTSVDSLNSPSHSLQHADANDAIEALETKLGIGDSPAGSATAGHVLVASTGGTTSWTTVSAGAISTTGGTAGQYLSAGTAGVAQWATVTPSGLTKVTTRTMSGSSGEVFTGLEAGSRYRFLITTNGSSDGAIITIRFREGSTDKATNYYGASGYAAYDNASGVYLYENNSTSFRMIRVSNTADRDTLATFDLFIPSTQNAATITGVGMSSSAWTQIHFGAQNTAMATCDGINIYPSAGTLTGKISVYKYED